MKGFGDRAIPPLIKPSRREYRKIIAEEKKRSYYTLHMQRILRTRCAEGLRFPLFSVGGFADFCSLTLPNFYTVDDSHLTYQLRELSRVWNYYHSVVHDD